MSDQEMPLQVLPPGYVLAQMPPSVSDQLIALIDIPIPPVSASESPLVSYAIRGGWKVSVFYDDGRFAYLHCFISPDGMVIDFRHWPESYDRQRLLDWSPS